MHIYSKKIDYDKHIQLSTIKIYHTNMNSSPPPPSSSPLRWSVPVFSIDRVMVLTWTEWNQKEYLAVFFFPKNNSACVTSQHDWQVNFLASQVPILAGCCPLIGCYFQPWNLWIFVRYCSSITIMRGTAYYYKTLLFTQNISCLSLIGSNPSPNSS